VAAIRFERDLPNRLCRFYRTEQSISKPIYPDLVLVMVLLYNEDMNSRPLTFYRENEMHTPLKVTLFTRIHELKGITDQLSTVANYPKEMKASWVKENESILQTVFDAYAQPSTHFHFDDMRLDPEMAQMMSEYTSGVQQFLSVFQNILPSKNRIAG
jgi:hypothetical protein